MPPKHNWHTLTCNSFVVLEAISRSQFCHCHPLSVYRKKLESSENLSLKTTLKKSWIGCVKCSGWFERYTYRNGYMERECGHRVLLLDFGHPMNMNTIENVINSLENVLVLGSALRRHDREINIGISVLNSDFTTFQSQSTLHKDYHLIVKRLGTLLKTLNARSRITVQEYKYLLSRSIEAILCEFQKFKKYDGRPLIQIAVITKKNATVLADILKDVTKKLAEINPNVQSVEKYKIVQIRSEEEEEICEDPRSNSLIYCTSCIDNIHELNDFLKDWLLNPHQQLRLLLSKDPQFWVECDMHDCIINPASLMPDGKLDLFSQPSSRSSKGTSKRSYKLEIIKRLSADNLCPSLVFGIPRRLYATASSAMGWTESQNNWKIFKQLCRELRQTRQGLLARTVLQPAESNYITSFHFLTSDGDMLLLSEVSPEELYFPKREPPPSRPDSCEDPNAAFVIKDCLKKIEYVDECVVDTFSTGIFDHLRRYMEQIEESKKHLQPLFPGFKVTGEQKTGRKDSSACQCHADGGSSGGASSSKGRKKKQKTSSEEQTGNVHPALLTPDVVEKYRKVKSNAFNLPEFDLNCGVVAPK